MDSNLVRDYDYQYAIQTERVYSVPVLVHCIFHEVPLGMVGIPIAALVCQGYLLTTPPHRSLALATPRLGSFQVRSRTPQMPFEDAVAQPLVFEAQADPMQFALLLAVVVLPFGYWWYVTVPDARLDLAKDKRKGGLRAYIDDLRADAAPRGAERWFFRKYLRQLPEKALEVPPAANDSMPAAVDVDAYSEESQRSPSLEELLRPASLKGNPTPRFWSGDNPIVVTMGALLFMGVAAAAYRSNATLTVDALVLAAGIMFGLSRLSLD